MVASFQDRINEDWERQLATGRAMVGIETCCFQDRQRMPIQQARIHLVKAKAVANLWEMNVEDKK